MSLRLVLVTQIAHGLGGSMTPPFPFPPHIGPLPRGPPNLLSAAAGSMMENASNPSRLAATPTDVSTVVALTPACTAPAGVPGPTADAQGPQSTPNDGKPSPPFPPLRASTSDIPSALGLYYLPDPYPSVNYHLVIC